MVIIRDIGPYFTPASFYCFVLKFKELYNFLGNFI